MSGRPAELRALTGARGIAAWLVVLYHIRLSIAGLPGWALAVLARGYLAVDFFFLLSGLVIWLAWHERLRAGGSTAVVEFLRRRVARIWPLHLLLLAASVALALALLVAGRPDQHEYPFAQLPLQALLVQNWGFTDALAWNEPAWSISAELGAYLLFAWLARRVDWRRWTNRGLIVVAAGLLLTLAATMADKGVLSADIARFGLPRCIAEFGTGTIVAALWSRSPKSDWSRPAILAAALIALRIAGVQETLVLPAILAAVLMVLARTANTRGNPLEIRAIHYLGEISFATYLAHMLLWRVFKLAMVADPMSVPLPLVILYLATVLTASIALYELVERPAQRRVQGMRLPQWLAAGRRVRRPAPGR